MNQTVSIVIPTLGREQVLVDTIGYLLGQLNDGDEIVIVDQTPRHTPAVERVLGEWNETRKINWIRLERPSITAAMNRGILASQGSILLFVDDDIIPGDGLIDAHRNAHPEAQPAVIAAGRVLQPWHLDGSVPLTGFAGLQAGLCQEFMGGNFSIDRVQALRLGGFDERFVKVAYRFEAEFALRASRSGVKCTFVPTACLSHLRATSGGTRSYGDHLRTLMPAHTVGEYYFLFGSRPAGWMKRAFLRFASSARTRHHLRRPWWIPVTLLAELLGILWALSMVAQGPALIASGK